MGLLAGTIFDRPPHCERCEKPETECQCPPPEPQRRVTGNQSVRVGVEKRKHGRMMTVVRDLNPDTNDLADLLTRLKNACGAGGTVVESNLEIQGSHVDRVRTELQKLGYRIRG